MSQKDKIAAAKKKVISSHLPLFTRSHMYLISIQYTFHKSQKFCPYLFDNHFIPVEKVPAKVSKVRQTCVQRLYRRPLTGNFEPTFVLDYVRFYSKPKLLIGVTSQVFHIISYFKILLYYNISFSLQDVETMSQVSDSQSLQIHQQTIDILVEEKAELKKSRDHNISQNQQLQGKTY